jgi:hypothetical protein
MRKTCLHKICLWVLVSPFITIWVAGIYINAFGEWLAKTGEAACKQILS